MSGRSEEAVFDEAAKQAEEKRKNEIRKNDARAKAAEAARASDSTATPTVVDGGAKLGSDELGEFQKQKADKHYRIIIPSTGKEDEIKRIPVIANGVFYTIQRDEEVVVPQVVLNILNDAIETRYRTKTDKDGAVELIPYNVKSYRYENLGEVDPTPITR
jgi:hypothetical protein